MVLKVQQWYNHTPNSAQTFNGLGGEHLGSKVWCVVLTIRHHLTHVFSPGWAQMRSLHPTALLYQYQISVKEREQTSPCSLNKSDTQTQTLTASLRRRSCSFLRAISLSFSRVIKACPEVASGSSASSRASSAAFVQMFSVRPASLLTGSVFSSILHGSSELKGKEPLINGTQAFIDQQSKASL